MIADPKTQAAMAAAFRSVVQSKPAIYDEAVAAGKTARRLALSARTGESLLKDWNKWLLAVDAEVNKVAPRGDLQAYLLALETIAATLSE